MRILLAASECAPLVKTGGLADVVSALPKALVRAGQEVRVLLPGYPGVMAVLEGGEATDLGLFHGGPARLVAGKAAGLDLIALDAPHLYDRPGNPYAGPDRSDWPDNAVRFAALSRAAARIGVEGLAGWQPDVLHVHDWQAGLAPAFVRFMGSRLPCLTTIHNIAFQGRFGPEVIGQIGLPPEGFTPEGYEFWGSVSFLKAGLVYADRISTVSPTYARELATPAFGMGLEGVIAARRAVLSGVLNGVETEIWDPEADTLIPAPYSARKLKAKGENRAALATRFGLSVSAEAPVFCVISRLTRQKGLDLLLLSLPRLLARGGTLAVLGSGDPDLEAGFAEAARQGGGRIGTIIGYDEPLSHLMLAGSDAILVPSRFEPCGLTQLYGLRYGTIPVVSRTGGLADTVIDANEAGIAAGVATGYQCAADSLPALGDAIDRACDGFRDRPLWEGLVRRAMKHPVGWETSAAAYVALYTGLARGRA